MSISRRRFLNRSGWLTAASLGLSPAVKAFEPPKIKPGQTPRNIIHLVSDGMSPGILSGGDQLSQILRGRGLTWLELYNQPGTVCAMVNMRSLNSLVTDSAAASSSWGSGSRVVNGALNHLPDGRSLTPLYRLFHEAGWKRGLVTTTEITHATPAGFASTSSTRDAAESIAQQYLTGKIEVLLGGGQMFFYPNPRRDKRDLCAAFREQGYAVFATLSELNSAPLDRPWLGLFTPSHLPFTIDHMHDADDLAPPR
ncbi:MAG: alkaline phosphatase, partial [Candidatus Omnitrophica bacterium]|nr:alkaline phosphatase [Candidatus Omnitrophota bacterium]